MQLSMQCLVLLGSMLLSLPIVNMKFYPENMNSLKGGTTNLYTNGYGSFAAAVEMAIVSHLRLNDLEAVSILTSMTASTMAQMGQSRLVFVPEMDKITEHLRRDYAFACLRKVHENVVASGEKTMKKISDDEQSRPAGAPNTPFVDVAPKYKTKKPGWVGAMKMGMKSATLKFDYYKTTAFRSKQFTRFWQFTKPARQFAGKGARAVLGKAIGTGAAKVSTKVFAKLGVPLMDIVTFGMSLDTFIKGVKQKNTKKIVGGTIGMVGSVVGMTFFLLCVFKGAAFASVWGPVGLVVGFLFLFAGLLVSLLWPTSREDLHNALMEQLKKVSKASLDELGPIYDFLKKSKKRRFDDVYVANQAAMYYSNAEDAATRNEPLTFKEQAGPYKLSFKERRPKSPIDDAARSFFSNSSILHQGFLRTMVSPKGKRESLGLDFNGLFTPAGQYNGITVFMYTNLVQTVIIQGKQGTMKGVDIDLTGDPSSVNHHVVIGRYHHVTSGKKIKIRTGSGHDSLSLDGPISGSEDFILDADLGAGENTLSFLGGYRDYVGGFKTNEYTMLGFFFDVGSGELKYRRGGDWAVKPMGHVKGVKVLVGSSKPDFIHLTDDGSPDDFSEGDTANAFDRYQMDHFTVIQMYGTKTYVLDLSKIPKTRRREFTIIDTAIDDSYGKVSPNMPGHYPYCPYLFITYDESEGMTYRRMVYKEFTLSIYRDEKGDGVLKEMIRIYIKTPRWPEIQFISKQDSNFRTAWYNMENYKHSVYWRIRVPYQSFTPIHEEVFPVYLPDGKNMTITGSTTQGTSHSDFMRLSCRSGRGLRSNFASGTWTVDMGAGTDYVCIGRDFLDGCVIDYKDPIQPKEVLLMKINGGNLEFHFEYEKNSNPVYGKDGKLIIRNAEKIINEYGQVIVDLNNHKFPQNEDMNVIILYSVETRKKMGLREDNKNCQGDVCNSKQDADNIDEEEDPAIANLVGDDTKDDPDEYCRQLGLLKDKYGELYVNADWS